ncbi:WD repeat-containing protein 49-like [Polypterus senegalus]|uniref:WD repeat-containing protein 49-like n=1 Tax=Polypterus senegalus TaxID=55291 RepID=UPI0019634887|nr:WD repeat-containing protein 49-like [Polypterus senegalus]
MGSTGKTEIKESLKREEGDLQNRMNMKDFEKMKTMFLAPDLSEPVSLTREEFIDRISSVVGWGTKKEYGELFDRIDVTRDGSIDWEKVTSFLLLELNEKDERTKSTIVPQWKDIVFLPLLHKEAIHKMVYLKTSSRYLSVSKDGLLGVWGDSLELHQSIRIATDSVRPKDLWVTSLASMPNVNKIAVAFTSKEICFYDLLSKQEFSCQYKLQDLENTPLSMDYWYNPSDLNKAVLSFGDTGGQVNGICFTTAMITLFERTSSSPDQDSVTIIKWKELISSSHKCCYVFRFMAHSRSWVRQVKYIGNLEAFLSCSTCSTNSMVLGWKERDKAAPRTTTISTIKGINAFDYHVGLNLIATAGVNNKVCLWNPYVISKPAGILQGHLANVIAVQFIVGKKQLLSFSKDKVLRVWDVLSQLCIYRISSIFPKCTGFHTLLFFEEDHGRLFLTFNGQISLLELKQETGKRITSHEKSVTCVLYNSVFKQVISSDIDSTVTFWMIDTGQKIKQFTKCHGNAEITTMALDASETRLFTAGTDGTVKVWDFNGHCHHKLNAGQDQSAEISQILVLKRTILILGWERFITIFRLNTFTQFFIQPSEWKGGVQHLDDILCAAFLPPHTLVTGSYDGEIIIWNSNTENASRRLHSESKRTLKSKSDSQIHKLRASGNVHRRGSIYPFKNDRSPSAVSEGDAECNYTVTRLCFLEARNNMSAAGGANLVSCGGSGFVRFWSTSRNLLIAEFIAHKDAGSIIMTVDNSSHYLITGDCDGLIKVWSIKEYCLDFSESVFKQPPPLQASFQPHIDCVTHLEMCVHNGRLLIISASADCSVAVSDIWGLPIGIFGQEEHWRIDANVEHFPENAQLLDDENNSTEDEHISHDELLKEEKKAYEPEMPEYITEVPTDLMEMEPVANIWENSILGKKFKERRRSKGNSHKPFIWDKIQSAVGTFSSLHIEELGSITEINKPDFITNPHKYFSEKSEEKSTEPAIPSSDSTVLIAAFDERSLFPKEILDRKKKSKDADEAKVNKKQKSKKQTRSQAKTLQAL